MQFMCQHAMFIVIVLEVILEVLQFITALATNKHCMDGISKEQQKAL